MKGSVTGILIVKNEEKHLGPCLETLQGWVDEVLVYDSGSTDRTEAIAAEYGARFVQDTDWQGFGRHRQKAQEQVRTDWCLWVDADERVSPELKVSILEALEHPEPDTVYALPRLTWAFGSFIRHCGWYPDPCLRLYPTALTRFNEALVHENVELKPGIQVRRLKGDLLHFSYDSLEHYLVKAAKYAEASAEGKARRGKKATLLQGLLHAAFKGFQMYVLQGGFLDGRAGFVLASLSAHATYSKYLALWLKARPQRPA